MKYRLIIAFLFPFSLFAQSSRFYVDAAAADANNGSAWADAFTDLNSALSAAQPGDSIWVAEGVYLPTADNARDSSFRLLAGVRLYGGFAGSETALDQRDWIAFPTVLSGDIGAAGDSTDNAYTIMYLDQPDSLTVVDGFTFRHGSATYPLGDATIASPRRSGGALYIMGADGEAYAIIRHCRFERNRARSNGGAVYINGAQNGSVAPQFLDCVFDNNSCGTDGGAVHRNGSSWAERTPDFGYCLFQDNQAGKNGGGLYFKDAERTDTLQLLHCDFINNQAEDIGGGSAFFASRQAGANVALDSCKYESNIAFDGAALAVLSNLFSFTNSVLIENALFTKNTNSGAAGRIISISMISKSTNSICRFSNVVFSENRLAGSMQGYGILAEVSDEGNLIIESSKFIDNTLNELLSTNSDSFWISNCTFERNTVHGWAFSTGYIQIIKAKNLFFNNVYTDTSSITNVALYFRRQVQFNAENINLNENKLFYLSNGLGGSTDTTSIRISNSILHESQSLAATNSGLGVLSVSLSNSSLYNTAFTCAGLPPGTCGPGMIEGVDPMFVDPASGDFRLQPCSPLVNAGDNALVSPDNTTDLAGKPRIAGGRVDMGAYETPAPNLIAAPDITPACPGTSSGSAAFQPENGCPPYEFVWSALGSGSSYTGLPAGAYTVTITDTRGSAFSASFTVPEGNETEVLVQGQAVLCGDTLGGGASATMLHAAPPFAYNWSNGGSDSLLTGLAAGQYLVTVTDVFGCTALGMVEVSLSGSLDVQVIVDAISCPGAADGSLTILPDDGKAPFKWVWENGPTGPVHAPLGPGTYLGTITDAFGCRISWVLPLTDPQVIGFQTAISPASGPSTADGAAALTDLIGGTPPFSAQWSNGDTGFTADSLAPGQYSVTVIDANGCERITSFEVTFLVGTQQPGDQQGMQLFPNPATAWVFVQVDKAGEKQCRLRVCDALGREILHTAQGALNFNVADWPGGIYTVQLWVAGRPGAVRKLVVRG